MGVDRFNSNVKTLGGENCEEPGFWRQRQPIGTMYHPGIASRSSAVISCLGHLRPDGGSQINLPSILSN